MLMFDEEYKRPTHSSDGGLLAVVLLLLAFLLVAAGAMRLVPWRPSDSPKLIRFSSHRVPNAESLPLINTPIILPGVVKPPALASKESSVEGFREVVGVIVDGRPRAYLLESLSPLGFRVVNDVIGQVPVTLIYDPQSDLLRVVTDKPKGRHLGINLGGYEDGDMYVLVRERTSTKPENADDKQIKIMEEFPYPDLDFSRLRWDEWLKLHPNSDIVTMRGVTPLFGSSDPG